MLTDANGIGRPWTGVLASLVARIVDKSGDMLIEHDNGSLVPWHYVVSIDHIDDWNNVTAEENEENG